MIVKLKSVYEERVEMRWDGGQGTNYDLASQKTRQGEKRYNEQSIYGLVETVVLYLGQVRRKRQAAIAGKGPQLARRRGHHYRTAHTQQEQYHGHHSRRAGAAAGSAQVNADDRELGVRRLRPQQRVKAVGGFVRSVFCSLGQCG